MTWQRPLLQMPVVPESPHPGSFGAVRRHDIHTGVDLYCDEGSLVFAVQSGIVVNVIPFTGPDAESPWWRDTKAVMVEGESGVVLYGEIAPVVSIGDKVIAGRLLGYAKRVLVKDKGLPTCMLHLELYKTGTRDAVWWRGGPCPKSLLDPTAHLKQINESVPLT